MVTFVVHGHFYQPPRENPWTEEVAREPSAAPFHDWNTRITAECYRPNGFARILDDRGRVVAVIDNYAHISFDMGPTLLAWMESQVPPIYDKVVSSGAVGGAIAQSFGHIIMPLANATDQRTQVRWGVADFVHRFGRRPAGMWLPECAVNDDVLAVMVEEGIGFTVLAPNQAVRVRPPDAGGDGWEDVTADGLDTRRPYRWLHPDGSGRGIDIAFYHGDLSHAAAFELGGLSSQALVDRVVAAGGDEGGLVLLATDGETFGHHHTWGDRLLAYALAVEAPRRQVEVSDLASWMASPESGPRWQVEIRESSWSCVHGVERWRSDCGCSTGGQPGWHQRWRAPLRAALDQVRDFADAVFSDRGSTVLRDPWAARDHYVDVLLGSTTPEAFAAEWVTGDPVVAFTLLESQRHAMAMYTSCGWFFNDLAGIETIQILRYAARVMDLLVQIGERPPETGFLEELAKAESNDPTEGDGRMVWRAHVEPARVGVARVVAHVALLDLLEGFSGDVAPSRLASYDLAVTDYQRRERGTIGLCMGRVATRHQRTGRRSERVYAAVRLGGLEVLGASRRADDRRDAATSGLLLEAFGKGAPVTTLLRMVTDGFGPEEFGLSSALPDGAERILRRTARALEARFASTCEQLFEDHRATLEALAAHGEPLPAALRLPAELALARRLESEVARHAGSSDPTAYQGAVAIARQAKAAGLRLETPLTRALFERLTLEAVTEAVADPLGEPTQRALGLLQLGAVLGIGPNLDRAQELVYGALAPDDGGASTAQSAILLLGAALGLAVESLGTT